MGSGPVYKGCLTPSQEIDIRGTAFATPEAVWALLDDSTTWPEWTPIDSCEIERPRGQSVNEVRRFVNGRITVREEIVERRPGERLTYVLIDGLPVSDYRAEIDLTPAGEGTEIRWHTTFDPNVRGSGWIYRRALEKATKQFVAGLVERAGADG